MTYAIIETGGKQYKTQAGQELKVELLHHAKGKNIKLNDVLVVADSKERWIGQPYVKGSFVEAVVLGEERARKVISFKAIRREGGASTKIGHRQNYTKLKILSVKKPTSSE